MLWGLLVTLLFLKFCSRWVRKNIWFKCKKTKAKENLYQNQSFSFRTWLIRSIDLDLKTRRSKVSNVEAFYKTRRKWQLDVNKLLREHARASPFSGISWQKVLNSIERMFGRKTNDSGEWNDRHFLNLMAKCHSEITQLTFCTWNFPNKTNKICLHFWRLRLA